jgi:hypothetical protein
MSRRMEAAFPSRRVNSRGWPLVWRPLAYKLEHITRDTRPLLGSDQGRPAWQRRSIDLLGNLRSPTLGAGLWQSSGRARWAA